MLIKKQKYNISMNSIWTEKIQFNLSISRNIRLDLERGMVLQVAELKLCRQTEFKLRPLYIN